MPLMLIAILGQSSCKRSSNEYYTNSNKNEIYFSQFYEEDDVFWIGNDGQQLAKVTNGEYYFESLDSGSRYNAPQFAVKQNGDFEIEISITGPVDQSDSLEYYGVVIGQMKDSTFIDFKINNSGDYMIKAKYPIGSGEFEEGKFNTYKKLTVRKVSNELLFFIDENIMYSYKVDEFINLRTGPLTAPSSSVWVDYISVSEILN